MLNRAQQNLQRTFHSQMWNRRRKEWSREKILWYWKCGNASELSESWLCTDERFVVTMTGENFPDSKMRLHLGLCQRRVLRIFGRKSADICDYVSASEALQEIRGRKHGGEKEPALCSRTELRCQRIIALGYVFRDGKAFTIAKSRAFR